MRRFVPDPNEPVFRHGGNEPLGHVELEETFEVLTLDCFSGRLTGTGQHPREVAPYPQVNPLSGPFSIRGVEPGDTVAVHVERIDVERHWAVSTVSPRFGLLASDALAPTLEEPTAERVWIWHLEPDGTARAETVSGEPIRVRTRPFLGTLGLAPAHGEIKTSVQLGAFGGNLDSPLVTDGATVFLPASVEGGGLVLGDGHLAQGDGEVAGTGLEAEVVSRIRCGRLRPGTAQTAPRVIDEQQITSLGWGRPLDAAVRMAVSDLVHWVSSATGLDALDSYQWVSQSVTIRVANVVNPEYSVSASMPRDELRDALTRVHDTLREAGPR